MKTGHSAGQGVGREDSLQVREDIRRDEVMWIESGETLPHQTAYLAELEKLRLAAAGDALAAVGVGQDVSHFAKRASRLALGGDKV